MLLKPRYPHLNAQHPLAKGLVGAWPFFEGGGGVVRDLSGRQNHGTIAVAPWVGGDFGSCLSFATTASVSVPANASLQPGTFTISALVKSTSTTGGAYLRIVDQRYNGGFALTLEGGTGKALIAVQGTLVAGTTVIANDNKWHLVTGTYDGTTARIYLDGLLEGSAAASAPSYAGDPLTIGLNQTTNPNAEGWVGPIAGVALYNRALTAAEEFQLYRDSFDIYRSDHRWPPRAKASAASGAAVGAAAGVGAATGVGASAAKSPGAAAGTGTATGVGASAAAAVGAASGVGTATGVGASAAAGVGAASGTGTATGASPAVAPTAYASVRANAVPAIPEDGAVDPQTLRTRLLMISRTVNLLLRGKANVVTTLTLTASATSTTLTDERIGPASYIALSPLTENATILDLAPYISSRSSGSAVITHGSTPASDCTYSVLILG